MRLLPEHMEQVQVVAWRFRAWFRAYLRYYRVGEWEDVLQEAYLAVLTALPDYDPARGSPESFIYGVVRMRLRACSMSGGLIRVPVHALSRAGAEVSPVLHERARKLFSGGWRMLDEVRHDRGRADAPGRRLDLAELRGALAGLPAEPLLLLRRQHGETPQTLREIAATDGCSYETVRQRAARARAACRTHLEAFQDM